VVVEPSFVSPYSLRLEQSRRTGDGPDRPRPFRLRLVRAKGRPWAEMMKEVSRPPRQSDVVHLGDAEPQSALSAVNKATETKVVPVSAGLASRLTAVWEGALARTQYANEITVTPDGSSTGVFSALSLPQTHSRTSLAARKACPHPSPLPQAGEGI
jgi:hypothetical protein